MIVELKWDKSVKGALDQIKKKKYVQKVLMLKRKRIILQKSCGKAPPLTLANTRNCHPKQ